MSNEDRIWLLLLLVWILAALPLIVDRLEQRDVYTCLHYESPQAPEWCNEFLQHIEDKKND